MKPNGQARQATGLKHAGDHAERVRGLLTSCGRTCAQEAGMRRAGPVTWPSVAPNVGERMAEGTRHAGLPAGHDDLAALFTDSGRPSRPAAARVRLSLTRDPFRTQFHRRKMRRRCDSAPSSW